MIKITHYNNTLVRSAEVNGIPHVFMYDVLEGIRSGSWSDYSQILNSDQGLVEDLGLLFFNGIWMIPVETLSQWLYSFSLRRMSVSIAELFRVYRRDLYKVLRVVWALPTEEIIITRSCGQSIPEYNEGLIYELAEVFVELGVPSGRVKQYVSDGESFGLLHFLELALADSFFGPRGHLVSTMIQYLEELPDGDRIFADINSILSHYTFEPTVYLDDYIDNINIELSELLSLFIGEL